VNRPPWEVADVIRRADNRVGSRHRESLTWPQVKVLNAIARCRTAALGGHRDRCARCGYEAISYNSCRNRHCPKCQTNAREKWLAARQQELLPVSYYHLVFSVPHALVLLIWQNKKLLFKLLFETSAATLLEIAADPKHLGAEIGFLTVLHTWGQALQRHPHVHCVVPGGGLSADHRQWTRSPPNFFLPVKVLSRVFRGKFVAGLKRLFRQRKLASTAPVFRWQTRRRSTRSYVRCFAKTGSFMRNGPSADPNTSALPGPVYPPRSDFQPPHRGRHRHSCHLSLEGLRAPQQAPYDDAESRGIPAPLSRTCPAEGIPTHSLLRIPGKSAAR